MAVPEHAVSRLLDPDRFAATARLVQDFAAPPR
jgi:hypothetical protein